jgi:hypothetical protein
MITEIPDPQSFKQLIDCVGYSVMGLLGVLGAWQRMKNASGREPNLETPDAPKQSSSLHRLERVEQAVVSLKTKQEEMYEETLEHQRSILQQQAAVFNLLIQQRNAIDKILGKMGGL